MTSYKDIDEWELCSLEDLTSKMNIQVGVKKEVSPNPFSEYLDIINCEDCNVEMKKLYSEYNLICPQCNSCITVNNVGEHTISAGENHNISNNSYMNLRITGKDKKQYENVLRDATHDYKKYRNYKILKTLKQHNFTSADFQLPQVVLNDALDTYIKLKSEDFVRRGMILRGVLGACLYIQCQEHNITKTRSQIAKLMKIPESKLSFGLHEIERYAERGIIDIKKNLDPALDYFNAYFESFEIPVCYIAFAKALYDRIEKKKIKEVEQCYNTTKCVGIIYFICILIDISITHEMIAQRCDNISRGTYLNVYNAILKNESKLRKVFKRHNMKLPAGWKPFKSS
jgi:transcription initiation factor TFIIIB Brf1 subunit/transcription initiation factor TFIIB